MNPELGGTLYRIDDPGESRPVWLGILFDEERMYLWLPQLGRWVRSYTILGTFADEQPLLYTVVDLASARCLIDAQVGKLDRRRFGKVIKEFAQSSDWLGLEEVLGSEAPEALAARTSNRRARANALASIIARAPGGSWIAWQRYPSNRPMLAHQAAQDFRRRKVRALAGIPLETRVRVDPNGLVVEARRATSSIDAGARHDQDPMMRGSDGRRASVVHHEGITPRGDRSLKKE